MFDKVKAWFKNSLTILWARVVALGGLILGVMQGLTADPNISAAIQSMLQAKYIPYYVIAIGIITELARRRTVEK